MLCFAPCGLLQSIKQYADRDMPPAGGRLRHTLFRWLIRPFVPRSSTEANCARCCVDSTAGGRRVGGCRAERNGGCRLIGLDCSPGKEHGGNSLFQPRRGQCVGRNRTACAYFDPQSSLPRRCGVSPLVRAANEPGGIGGREGTSTRGVLMKTPEADQRVGLILSANYMDTLLRPAALLVSRAWTLARRRPCAVSRLSASHGPVPVLLPQAGRYGPASSN
jgi:hypothetical protein